MRGSAPLERVVRVRLRLKSRSLLNRRTARSNGLSPCWGGAPILSRLCGEASVMSGVIKKQLHTHGTVVAREDKYVRAML